MGQTDILQELKRFVPNFSESDYVNAASKSQGDLKKAMGYLDELGIQKFQQKFPELTRSTIREMYAAHAGDVESASRHLSIWQKQDKKNLKRKENWLRKDPQVKAKELVRVRNISSYHPLTEYNILDESGPRWLVEPEEWKKLGEFDRKMEWLYTAVLLVETDHAEEFWNLDTDTKTEVINCIRQEGWSDFADHLERACADPENSETYLSEYSTRNLARSLANWIIDNAHHLSFFTVWSEGHE